MELNLLLNNLKSKMDSSIRILENELGGLRASRASTQYLDPVIVEIYGTKLPLNQASTITTPDSRTIMVQVWDKSQVKTIEKALIDANLTSNPIVEDQIIRINLPPISEERRKELVKFAHKYGENCKISLRNIRRAGMEELKEAEKKTVISKDDLYSMSDKVQKLTDDYVSKTENIIKSKELDIMKV